MDVLENLDSLEKLGYTKTFDNTVATEYKRDNETVTIYKEKKVVSDCYNTVNCRLLSFGFIKALSDLIKEQDKWQITKQNTYCMR